MEEETRAARSWREERKLLHWVNSLPPPACLLVETLADLRFGDVLLAIVHWLQAQQQRQLSEAPRLVLEATDNNGDDVSTTRLDMSCNASIRRLRHVLRLVTCEARSEDEDALFVVNEAHCAERIRGGEEDAICAVLRVLKRMGDQLKMQLEREEQQRQRNGDGGGSGGDAASRQQQRERSAITTELLRLSARREEVSAKSSNGRAKCKRNLRIVGLSSDRFREACSVKTRSQARVATRLSPAPIRADKAILQPAKPQKSTSTASPISKRVIAGVGLKKQAVRKPKTTKSREIPVADGQEPEIPMHRDSKGQLHVYSMVDPSNRRRAAHKSGIVNPSEGQGNQRERRVYAWMESLGVVLQQKTPSFSSKQPEGSPGAIFQNGVVLCQIAAGIVKLYGAEGEKRSLETFVDLQSPNKVVVLPPGATLCPQNAAQKRKNVAIAVEILTKFCGMQRVSNGNDNNDIRVKLVAFFTTFSRRKSEPESADDSVWALLDHIRVGIEASRSRVAANEALSQLNTTDKGLSDTADPTNRDAVHEGGVDENSRLSANVSPEPANIQVRQADKRRPYITSEQMQAVNCWLKSVDKDSLESSGKGLLQDPLRNGVLLCNLYARVFMHPLEPPLRFVKAPKTLAEVRQNLSNVLKRVYRLENFRMPPWYLSSSSWEAVIMGDRQVTYGILWYLWQFAQVIESRSRKEHVSMPVVPEGANLTDKEVESRESERSLLLSEPETKFKPKKSEQKERVSPKVCPILMDIPAAVLVNKKHPHSKSAVNLGFDCRGAFESPEVSSLWEDNHPSEHDLYPQPSAAPTCSTLDSSQDVSTKVVEDFAIESDVESEVADRVQEEETPSAILDTAPSAEPVSCDDDGKLAFLIPDLDLAHRTQRHGSFRSKSSAPRIVNPQIGLQHKTEVVKPSKHPSSSKESTCKLLAWLKSLKVQLSDPAAFQNPSARLTEFQSGVLLCSVVEKVEYMRGIQGVCRKATPTKASALHNISKALEILQQKKTMPLHLLRRKHDIYNGDRRVILELLHQIQKAYGHHHVIGAQPNLVAKPSAGTTSNTRPSKA